MKFSEKSAIVYITKLPCFNCKWSTVDPENWCLRCAGGKGTRCGAHNPIVPCGFYEEDKQ